MRVEREKGPAESGERSTEEYAGEPHLPHTHPQRVNGARVLTCGPEPQAERCVPEYDVGRGHGGERYIDKRRVVPDDHIDAACDGPPCFRKRPARHPADRR